MHDLALIGFLAILMAMGLRRPFLLVLAYVYIDTVSPQRLSYYLLNSVPISLICFGLMIFAWVFIDDKRNTRVAPRQFLIFALLVYCGITTTQADFPLDAADKWDWVWKALLFAIFLPLTLRTRLRIEALALFMVLAAASIIVVGGIKTVVSGGGYGSLNLMVDNNSGLYEGSIISTVAIAIIPLILFLRTHGTVFRPEWRVNLYAFALIFACLLMPIGTQARTGLVCAGILVLMMLRHAKRRVLYAGLLAGTALIAIPFLPSSFTQRMDTIKEYKADESASTRLQVWAWTWEYAQDHPFGGGFEAYRQNKIRMELTDATDPGVTADVGTTVVNDAGRAYHSSYFEMLGEQGWPGLVLWLAIHLIGLFRMELLHRRFLKRDLANGQWIGALALALQQAHVVYLVGSVFVGIAFQPFVYMLVGMQIGLDTYARRRAAEAAWRPIGNLRAAEA